MNLCYARPVITRQTNNELILAPGEGNKPISFYSVDCEYLAFPMLYWGNALNEKITRIYRFVIFRNINSAISTAVTLKVLRVCYFC